MFVSVPVLVAIFIVVFVYVYVKWTRHHRYMKNYPGPPPSFLIGNAGRFKSSADFIPALTEYHKKYGNVFRLYIANVATLIVADYNLLEFLLNSDILEKSVAYYFLKGWLGTGLLTASAEKWRKHRKIITPTFHFKILEQFVDTFNKESGILVDKLRKEVGNGGFNIAPYISLCTLDIICESAMGTSVNAQKNSESEYVKCVHEMCRIIIERNFSAVQIFDPLYMFTKNYRTEKHCLKVLHDYTNSVIQSRKKELAATKKEEGAERNELGIKKKMAFLDLLLQAQVDGEPLSDDDIRQEVDTFMFEGHDTTASGITFVVHNLAAYQDIQRKAFEEQKHIFGEENREATFRDLQDMKYLEQVIKESLRLYPSVPFYARSLLKDREIDGQILPEGLNVMINAFQIQRSDEFFPNPELFDPERFCPENNSRKPYCYLPFSAGHRNCIGQKYAMLEMKSTVSAIVRNFEIEPTIPAHKPEIVAETVLKSSNGIRIRLKNRNWDESIVN